MEKKKKKVHGLTPPCCRELKKENKKKKEFILEHPWPNRGKKGRGKRLEKNRLWWWLD